MSHPGDATPGPESGSADRELAVASRAARIIAWAVAIAGTGGGTLALRDGDLASALVVWTTTLAVAAVLVGTATLMRAVHVLAARVGALEALLRERRA